jgi:hypothetical protein
MMELQINRKGFERKRSWLIEAISQNWPGKMSKLRETSVRTASVMVEIRKKSLSHANLE